VTLDPSNQEYPLRDQWLEVVSPTVSIVVLNWNNGRLTRACLEHIWRNTEGANYEVIVVDNGSRPGDISPILRYGRYLRMIRLGVNRYFGEGNNIGAEVGQGSLLVFLNNDALVQAGWLEPLLDAMKHSEIGAAGARLFFPDGRVQESGALIRETGQSVQLDKGSWSSDDARDETRDVDYCSAAALAIRKELFTRVGGFDPCWEPAYYEDVDLCFKVRALGYRVVCRYASKVVHLEHATTSRRSRHMDLRGQPEFNLERFVDRWGSVLRGEISITESPGRIEFPVPPKEANPAAMGSDRRQATVGIYTPYAFVPGGGERYLLMLARTFAEDTPVNLIFPEPYSQVRLRQVAKDLRVDLGDNVEVSTYKVEAAHGAYDLFLSLGNEAMPSIPGLGRRNVFICQFPFPATRGRLRRLSKVARSYSDTVVYSNFAASALRTAQEQAGTDSGAIHVLYPPCAVSPLPPRARPPGPTKIVSVGRFFTGGHEKRHDILIEAVRRLVAGGAVDSTKIELHLIGSAMYQWRSRAYLQELERLAKGLPVHFHVNAPGSLVDRMLEESTFYWHAAGFDVDAVQHPERLEHFGIAIVEAMGRGCWPIVYGVGGPSEIVVEGQSGSVFHTVDELAAATQRAFAALSADPDEAQRRRTAVWERAREFSDERFVGRVREELEAGGDRSRDEVNNVLA
jgi:GT2 family glycosyltransferase